MLKFPFVTGDRSHSFEAFPTNEAIQATEIYEYAQKLSNPEQVNFICNSSIHLTVILVICTLTEFIKNILNISFPDDTHSTIL